ncbi:MAG: hypothetical protein WCF57_24295 [Pyrinomonadaceae bacterium]
MSESIEIRDIRLTDMASEQMTPVMAQSGVSWYNLTITVKNMSDVTPIHVMSDIRRIHYDASRRVLLVQLSEHDMPDARRVVGLPMPPRYRVIEPCEEVTLTHPLSSPITFLEELPDGARRPYFVRIAEDVDTIECTVAYDTEPPAPAVDLTSTKVPEQWRGRGATVTASWKPSREDRLDSSD